MGERRNDGAPSGRRREHPEGVSQGRRPVGQGRLGSGPHAARGTEGLEALLVRALVREGVDDEAEQRAVAAFREARETGAQRTGARARRRDDWRPGERRLGRFSVKTTLSVLIAGLSLGGVAVAGIGAAGSAGDVPGDDGNRGPTTAPADITASAGASAPGGPSAARSAGTGADSRPGSDSAAPERPARARDVEAHCRAYERVEGRGKALESVAWKRLIEAAGGAANVDAYCTERLRSATGEARPGGTGVPADRTGGAGGAAGNSPSDTGASGNGASKGAGDSASSGQGKPAQPGGEKKP
ncbi:hypothetical protein JL475_18195 [Streptomyces sp. M2CJ-2]|uniref:hypothetical protein n=1 Tax=Streptomyces sp. M2CJ-2 TaxID=2803948 RepID=UPI0019254048|nr:hypothetical protein [Streptomyces sp. M2CJ-2]MBL3667885.1 hypothetical protein [Streptomyces sp. M2CJ-2]